MTKPNACLNKTVEIYPAKTLDILSQEETKRMCDETLIAQYQLFRRCALAILHCENKPDNLSTVLEENVYKDFEISVKQPARGICIELTNAPACAFVEGKLIEAVRENLFAVLRDLIYVNSEIKKDLPENAEPSEYTTNQIFHILRNAKALRPGQPPNLVVCWGGHNISRDEYQYTKEVGYELGLRGLDVITGCGNGAMKGPMKGATIGSTIQRHYQTRFIGITEPGIIASESPNPIVNHLIIMPDIEKRLEAFIRTGHAIIQFPGGVGSTEELFFVLGILLHEENQKMPFPFILTGPRCCQEYFEQLNNFVGTALGPKAQKLYKIIIDDPKAVAKEITKGIKEVTTFRTEKQDAYHYNWTLKMDYVFQTPFIPNHTNMTNLNLTKKQKAYKLAAELRKTFSGIVAGNVKNPELITTHGPYQITGPKEIINPMQKLLDTYILQGRMKNTAEGYEACYQLNAT